ncbi:hypothetical protein B0H34DRAFT_188299 [Crassisporium funariophilum]|nr:hypothetical protein B0H34DRAFT_188299 [Crassisporium funariophilum]
MSNQAGYFPESATYFMDVDIPVLENNSSPAAPIGLLDITDKHDAFATMIAGPSSFSTAPPAMTSKANLGLAVFNSEHLHSENMHNQTAVSDLEPTSAAHKETPSSVQGYTTPGLFSGANNMLVHNSTFVTANTVCIRSPVFMNPCTDASSICAM